METGFIPNSRATALPPLFTQSQVQYTPPSDILDLTAANNILFLATSPLSVVIIDLNHPDELVTIDLPKPQADKQASVAIRALYADPQARHLIITTTTGDAFYLPITPGNASAQQKKPRPLRLRANVTAVAWSPVPRSGDHNDPNAPPPTDVLLGTANGTVLSLPLPPTDDIFKSVNPKATERDLQHVYSLPRNQTVEGIAFGFWHSDKKRNETRAWVVITTKDRVYEVQGPVTTIHGGGKGGGWAEEVFKPARDGPMNFQELSGSPKNSELRTYTPTLPGQDSRLKPPTAIAWLTEPGLYNAAISATPTPEVFHKASLYPYPPAPEPASTGPAFSRSPPKPTSPAPVPISFVVTQWHWLFLYNDRIVGVSRETDKVVWEEPIPLDQGEVALGLSSDPISKTFWIYTERKIIEVVVNKEERDVWRAKLERNKFAEALEFASTPAQRDIVLSRQGDALYDEGKFILAARAWAESTRSFEYVTLKFIDADERDALRAYLTGRLDKLDKKVSCNWTDEAHRQDLTQRMMLATWLLEIYLNKCNTLEDLIASESATSDGEMVEDDLQSFMKDYKANLDPAVVYELIQGHGRTDLYLFFAELNKDWGKIVEHWIAEEQWDKAIEILSRQDDVDLYYRFSSLLMRNAPRATVDAWIRQSSLSPRRLIPALLLQKSEPLESNQAVRYLEHVIHRQGSTDSTIYNLLLTLYACDSNEDDAPLIRFLSTCPDDPLSDKPFYDLDYALRLCKKHGRIQACVLIYSRMGLYENSVDLALEKGDLELAKENADRPEDDLDLRKKLWLKIAKYVVQEKSDIKSAMRFLEATDLVKIEDILPFFPDFVVIDDFKTEICTALEDYSARIEELKKEMTAATHSAESIKRDIEALSSRFVAIETSDKCWRCDGALTARQFYVFPCQHAFHTDCLISMVSC